MVVLNPDTNHPVSNPCGWTPPISPDSTPTPEDVSASSRAGHGIGVLGMIWAEDKAQVLGAGGKMLWHVPADFKHFKDTTMGSPIIMGRASFISLGQALPGRRNIVLTGSREFTAPDVEIAHSLEEALELCACTPQVWITGGAKVYREVMELGLADLLVVTQLDMTAMVPPMNTVAYAPVIDPVRWQLDLTRSDENWRPKSGDAAWRVRYYIPR